MAERSFDVLIFDTVLFLPEISELQPTVRRSALPSLSVDASTCLGFLKNPAIQRLAFLPRRGC